MFAQEYGPELLLQRLETSQSQLWLLLHRPVLDTTHNRALIGLLTRIVGAYVRDRAARYQLSTRVRQQLATAAEDAIALEGSIERAMNALRREQPKQGEKR